MSRKKQDNYFASSNPHPPHSRAYDRYNKFLRILDFDSKFPALLDIKQNQTGELLWRNTGGIHWRKLASRLDNYWPDTRQDPPARDPLTSRSGGILGRIHWRAALAGYLVGAWIANADSNIKSNNPFLSGGELIDFDDVP